MSGLPKGAAKNVEDRCTEDWACTVELDGQHCVCRNDSPVQCPDPCCQCDGADNDPPVTSSLVESCPRCGEPTDPDWFCSEGYCPDCCTETDEGGDE